MSTDLGFAVSGGARFGMGHVMRAAVLAGEALARGRRVSFALHGDATAERALREEVPGAAVTVWSSPLDLPGAERTIFDTRLPIADVLHHVRSRGSGGVVLDRLDVLEEADLTVVPVLHAPEIPHPRYLGGADYCVLAPALRAEGVAPYPGARDVALVTLGGADPHGLTEPACDAVVALLDAWEGPEARPTLHCVIGPAFREPAARTRRLERNGAVVHPALSRTGMRDLMARSLFAVVGFGTTITELAWMGVPMVYLTHHAADLDAATTLEARGVGASGGLGPSLHPEALSALLRRVFGDPSWRREAQARGRALLGRGEGASRIVDAALGLETTP